jgi:LysM domain-containing protein
LAQPYKLCPICGTPNHRNAALCSTCGASLKNVGLASPDDQTALSRTGYKHQYGETDLFEESVPWRSGTYFFSGIAVLVLLLCVGLLVVAGPRLFNNQSVSSDTGFNTITPDSPAAGFISNTPRPTIFLPTVTPGAPTPTPTDKPTETPEPGPCIQTVLPGDDLYAIMFRCGHRQFDTLLQTVLDMNKITDANRIKIGQQIEVPWPTPTVDPNAAAEPTSTLDTGSLANSVAIADTGVPVDVAGVRIAPTETLPAGVIWHRVQKDENAISIAIAYGATLRILSELNPEVQFSQCDFGLGSGGPNCVVLLAEGQMIRVPEPTVTPTTQPTPSGSETSTPTITPTFNQPSALSPSDLAFFQSGDIVTLRWIATGSLIAGQTYQVRLEDQTSGTLFTATTQELFFILPDDWHAHDGVRHDYLWTVALINTAQPNQPIYVTEPRRFTWLGLGK